MNYSKFMRQNKIERKNEYLAVTKSLLDDDGTPLLWELKPVTAKEESEIRDRCTDYVQKGKKQMPRFNSGKYLTAITAAAVVVPDLHFAELQDSYGVKSAEDLLEAIVDHPGELNDLVLFVQKMNGFDTTDEDLAEEAKN